ncbi:DUF6879 family protein [Micromonospora sediminimaris]|uniref:DUF6879 family protein n=1 Tax=Micromonospora sediminimaris TaxID=547162 RepID=UPI003795F089
MRDLLDQATGRRLAREEYLTDFWERFWAVDGAHIWKLERRQHFQEPGYGVWEAFARGDWPESMRLLQADRQQIAAEHRRMARHAIRLHWVRVVEPPLSEYVRWNLHVLRIRAECGTDVRIVGPPQVAPLEVSEPLPELVAVADETLYEVRYDVHGALVGADRYADADLVRACRQVVTDLHRAGEPLADYFPRELG